MKKIAILIIVIGLIIIPTKANAQENTEDTSQIISDQKQSLNIKQFITQADKYTKDTFEDIDYNQILESAIKGDINNGKLVEGILKIFGKETIASLKTIASIMVIIIIHSIIKSLSEGLENKGIAQITYYVQYILIVTLIISNFADVITMIRNSIDELIGFANILIPMLITLIITTGHIVSANILQPVLLIIITFIGNIISNVLIPMTLISTVLAIVSKLSDRIQLDKLSKFLKSGTVWILGIVLTLFVTLVSVEGSLGNTVDVVTAKTAKAVVSNVIPVVGKILSDAVDTVIGCTTVLKNAVGIIGVIVIIGICIAPIIKLLILMGVYYIGAALCQPIADEKIVKLLEQMGDTFKVLLAILCSVSVMLIIGTTLVMKISGS